MSAPQPPSEPTGEGSAPPAPFGTPESGDDTLERLSNLARTERRALAAVARSEGLAPEAAVDCVQDGLCTLLDLLQSGQVAEDAELGPVLATIVRNAARNQRRRHFHARPHVELVTELTNAADALQDELLARAEDTVRLRACVAELCEIQRAVVTLRLLEERPGEDVAALLGVTKNHVGVLLHRSKASLRVCLSAPGAP
jgi:RNA polymerase sigma-70 factor, ECF subfamily